MKKVHKNHIIVFILILIYVVLSFYKLDSPGIQYDEILFGNAARGGYVDDTFIVKRVKGFPVLVMEYIGAIKAYVYFPIFRLFGVSTITIRFPVILLTGISFLLLYRLVILLFSPKVALISVLLTILHPDVFAFMRADVGPSAFTFFFRVSVLYCFFAWLRNKDTKSLIFVCCGMVLGWFSKMDFVWFIIAVLAGMILCFRKELFLSLGKISKKTLWIIGIIAMIVAVVFAFWGFQMHFFSTLRLLDWNHINIVFASGKRIILGTSFFEMVYGSAYGFEKYMIIPYGLFIIYSLVQIRRVKPNEQKKLIFLFAVPLFIFVQIFITAISGAPWHLMYLLPFIQILVAYGIVKLFTLKSLLVKMISGILLALLIGYSCFGIARLIALYDSKPSNINWSKAIYQLIAYTKSQNKRFVSVDWGVHTQLLAFDYQKDKYFNYWPSFNEKPLTEVNARFLTNTFFKENNVLFLTHSKTAVVFPQTRINLFDIAHKYGYSLRLVKQFYDHEEVIYELYIARKKQ